MGGKLPPKCFLGKFVSDLPHPFFRHRGEYQYRPHPPGFPRQRLPLSPAASGLHSADRFVTAYRAVGFRIVGHLTFPKTYASSSGFLRYQHESAYLLIKGNPAKPEHPISDVLAWKYSENRHHPSEKSVSTLTPLVEAFSLPGGLVLDPFAGSGSTLLAAKSLGRNYVDDHK